MTIMTSFFGMFNIFTTSSVIASANRSFSLWVLPLYIATVIIGIIIIITPKLVQKVIAGYDMLIIASYLWSMSYKPLAELYSSHRIPIAPFGIGRDEILPGSLQV
jgi:Na+/citrate or Na+/malate symporter